MTFFNQGAALMEANRIDEAAEKYRQALLRDPGFAEAYNNFGHIHQLRGRNAEAEACYVQAIACDPTLAQPHVNLGNLLLWQNDLDAACEHFDAALALDPGNWDAQNNRAQALLLRGDHAEARAAFAAVVQMRPDSPVAASNKLYFEVEACDSAPERLFQEYVAWGRQFAEPLAAVGRARPDIADPERRLRVGYVSPDFRGHAMGYFIEPLLANCNAAGFELYCYNNWSKPPDSTTVRFKGLAHHWRDIALATDAEAAQQIAEDEIDLLVDLSGHSAGNRLLVFARKPAPLQFTYLGYMSTTGVRAIDYRITDALCDPPGMTEACYVETLLRLPDSMLCYRAPDRAQAVGPLPAIAAGTVTFGSFNRFMKVSEAAFDAWANLLHRVPESRLIMVTVAPGAAQSRARAAFAARGIGSERLTIYSRLELADYLALYNQVDIALDPFPVNGGTTTCESLWMGVPVVALAGNAFASRVGLSLLTNIGLPELVAGDAANYVNIAAALASDLPRLSALRADLRERMRASPLCDAPRFIGNLERLYRDVWRQWCARRRMNDALHDGQPPRAT